MTSNMNEALIKLAKLKIKLQTKTDKNSILALLIVELQERYPYVLNYYVPPTISKRLYSLYYILGDIELAFSAIRNLAKLVEGDTQSDDGRHTIEIVWYGLLVAYCRCFTYNKGQFSRLETTIFKNDDRLLSIHEKIMDTRHRFVAHREDTFMIEAVVAVVVPDNMPDDNQIISIVQRRSFEESDLVNYAFLLSYLKNEVLLSIEKENDKISQKLKVIGPAELESLWVVLTKLTQSN